MHSIRHCLSRLAPLALVLTLCSGAALANEEGAFPSKPIRMVVPTTGGTVDLIARYVAPKLSEAWKQPVVVDTKAGASGNIAAAAVAKSPGDGYTILAGYNPLAISSFLSKNLAYDLSELAPITLAVSSPQVLAVRADLPVNTLQEFVALAKAKRGDLNYASISAGSASHLTMELFKTRAGVELKHIPYKGAAPAMTDLLGGTVDAGFFAAANVINYVKAGRMKALAVTGSKRLRSLPNVPAMSEAGYPKFDATIWIGFLAPATTPPAIIEKYNQEIVRILRSPDVRSKIEGADFEVEASTPAAFAKFIRSEIETWEGVARQANIRLD